MRSIAVIVTAGVLAAACGSTAGTQPAVVLGAPSATTAPTFVPAVPSPTASPGAMAPVSAGAVPDAGIVYVWGADDGIYRYDGTTGALTRVSGASTLARESAYGPYVLGRHGGTTLLRWDGTTQQVCGGGNWSVFSTRETCAYLGSGADSAVYTSYTGADGAPISRTILPADWGAGTFVWDWNGLELAIIRNDARPEPVRQHQTLWVMDLRHGTLRKVFDPPSETSFIFGVKWSPDRRVSFWESATTSASFGADGVLTSLHVVNVDTAADTDLGMTLQDRAWAQWSSDGRLAFVRGGGRETWFSKQVVVLELDGRQRVVAGDLSVHPTATSRAALAPAWQPAYRQPQLAWIESPAVSDASPDYFRGIGPSAERIAVADDGRRIACPGLVTEGIRLSADATAALLLCRVPGVEHHALQLWYAAIDGASHALVTGLGDLGFGFYGMQPSLFDITAWSLADR